MDPLSSPIRTRREVIPRSGIIGQARPNWEKRLDVLQTRVQEAARRAGLNYPVTVEVTYWGEERVLGEHTGENLSTGIYFDMGVGPAYVKDPCHRIYVPAALLYREFPRKWRVLDGSTKQPLKVMEPVVREMVEDLQLPKERFAHLFENPLVLEMGLLFNSEKSALTIDCMIESLLENLRIFEKKLPIQTKSECDMAAAVRLCRRYRNKRPIAAFQHYFASKIEFERLAQREGFESKLNPSIEQITDSGPLERSRRLGKYNTFLDNREKIEKIFPAQRDKRISKYNTFLATRKEIERTLMFKKSPEEVVERPLFSIAREAISGINGVYLQQFEYSMRRILNLNL